MSRPSASWLLLLLPLGLAACPGTPEDKPDSGDTGAGQNEAPALTVDSPEDGARVEEGTALVVSGFVADDATAAADVAIAVASDVDGDLASLSPDASGTFSTEVTLSVGDHVLTVTAVDEDGASSTVERTVTITSQSVDDAPSAPVVHIDPQLAVSGDTLLLVVDEPGVDPEGAAVEHVATWQVDYAEWGQGDEVPGDATMRGQIWIVSVVATDGVNESEPALAEVRIANAPPTATAVTLTPAVASVDDPIACAVEGTADVEGDPVEVAYGWTVDGAATADTGDTLPAGSAGFGQEVVCIATLSDGFDTASFSSAPLVVGNSAPGAAVVEVTPAEPADTEDLSCAVVTDAVDPDGDAVAYTYAWYADGVATGHATATVPAADTHRDEVWTCEVVATDAGGLSGPAAGASVTIGLAWEGDESAADAYAILDGDTASGQFGKTLALVGDLDGDSLSELMVGANGIDASTGKVYLFAGADLGGAGSVADATASWVGSDDGAQLGGFRAVAAPGDVDGDGVSELFFAAPVADANGTGSGAAYLFYGGGTWGLDASPDDTADAVIEGSTGDKLGARLTAGDLDGDGFVDLIVASPGASSTTVRESGEVAVYLGGASRFSGDLTFADRDHAIVGEAVSDQLGWTTKLVGDPNGDGYEDLFVTSIYADPSGMSEAGTAGLVLGGSTLSGGEQALSSAASALFYGDSAGDRMGYDVVGDVDLDRDGVDDLIVGAYLDDASASNAGSVWVYLGRSRWASEYQTSDADHAIYGDAASAQFGHVMVSPGDLDQDGNDDVVIGASGASPTGLSGQGAAWVLLGPDWDAWTSSADIAWSAYGEAASDAFGDALSFGGGDVDGDGLPDFGVGAQGQDTAASGAGRVYLWRGR